LKKVIAFTKYSRLGASSRLRIMQYTAKLKNLGYEIEISSLTNDEYLKKKYSGNYLLFFQILYFYIKRVFELRKIFSKDIIWIEYELFPFLPSFFEILITLLGKKYIVDYDDSIFENYKESKNFFVRNFLSKKIDNVIKNSEVTITGNKYLERYAKDRGAKHTKCIPTVVDESKYDIDFTPNEKQDLVIGWIGSPGSQKLLKEYAPSLNKLCKDKNIKLEFIGANSVLFNWFDSSIASITHWTEKDEAYNLQNIDIGIMPLTQSRWSKGKCGYKIIQFMACNKPVVASYTEANSDIVKDNECGLLAENIEQFIECLNILISDKAKREEMGMNGKNAVRNTYNINTQAHELKKIFMIVS
tara:strand:+ start:5932 stop:7005 length:1074 start_codon:yes stop_codon:yes gene_type:complete